jgi:putative oxidoreductase
MENLFLVGRVLVGSYFIMSAYNHLAHPGHLTGYAASKGVPSPKLAILASGVLILLGGLSILTGIRPALGVAAIVLFLIPVTFTMHAFWKDADPMAKMGNRINFMKNIALLGAALMFLAIPTPWPFSL